jgi:hypothetical protein
VLQWTNCACIIRHLYRLLVIDWKPHFSLSVWAEPWLVIWCIVPLYRAAAPVAGSINNMWLVIMRFWWCKYNAHKSRGYNSRRWTESEGVVIPLTGSRSANRPHPRGWYRRTTLALSFCEIMWPEDWIWLAAHALATNIPNNRHYTVCDGPHGQYKFVILAVRAVRWNPAVKDSRSEVAHWNASRKPQAKKNARPKPYGSFSVSVLPH